MGDIPFGFGRDSDEPDDNRPTPGGSGAAADPFAGIFGTGGRPEDIGAGSMPFQDASTRT